MGFSPNSIFHYRFSFYYFSDTLTTLNTKKTLFWKPTMSDEVPQNNHVDPTTIDDIANNEAHTSSISTSSSSSSSSSSSAVAVGKSLSTLLSSVIQDFDSKAEATISSQDQLAFALDRLTGELDQLLDAAPLPFIMQHAARISNVRKRVTSLNSVLKSIQRRVDNIDRMVSAGVMQETVARESGGRD